MGEDAGVAAGRGSLLREYLEALLIAIVFAIFARTFVVQAFRIPSESMAPNLLVGDHILVNKFIYSPSFYPWERWLLPLRPPRRGDVVVFRFPLDPQQDYIKRCVGLAGDIVEIDDKRLLINRQEMREEGYAHFADSAVYSSRFVEERWRLRDNYGPDTVPPRSLFCLGDNRDNSNDSRFWGPVPAESVRGRALLVYWSFDSPAPTKALPAGSPPGSEKSGGLPEGLGEGRAGEAAGFWQRLSTVARHFFSQTRWERTFKPVR